MSRQNVIFETPFPIYCVKTVGDRHFLVAGGGGQAKTGVPNHVEIFLFDVHENSWDLLRTTILDTGIMATMNLDILPIDAESGSYLLACGQEGLCRVYNMKFDIAVLLNGQLLPADVSVPGNVHSRRSRTRSSQSASSLPQIQNGLTPLTPGSVQKLGFSCEELKAFQTDFTSVSGKSGGGAFQKVVRFHSGGKFLVTGGADGHFRVWEWPSCEKLLDHNAHKDDVDDLDISPDGTRLVTVGRDGGGYVWQIKDAKKLADLTQLDVALVGNAVVSTLRDSPPRSSTASNLGTNAGSGRPTKYRYRFCRFAPALTTARSHTFFTCAIPIVRNAKKQACYISRWLLPLNDNKCRQVFCKTAPTGGEVISTLCISDDGAYIGLGTLGGSVVVLETDQLTPLQMWKETHEIFVTAVDFLPTRPSPRSAFSPLVAGARCALVSCSAANCCQLHVIPKRQQSSNFTWLLFCATVLLILFFYVLEFFDL